MGKIIDGLKECPGCKQTFEVNADNFFWQKRKDKGHWSSYCKPCQRISKNKSAASHRKQTNATTKAWRDANKERLNKEFHDKYFQDVEKSREYRRNLYQRNRESRLEQLRLWKEANPEKVKGYERKYRSNNPDKSRANVLKRREALKQNGGHYTGKDLRAKYDQQNGKCFYCGCEMGDKYSPDHVIPVSKGGTSDPSNIVLACRPCNRRKHTKLPGEWLSNSKDILF